MASAVERLDIMERPSARRYSRPVGLILALMVITLIGSLLVLMQTGRVTAQSHEVQRLQQLKTHWQQRNAQLAAEIAVLSALDRVQSEATTRLRMTPATRHVFVPVAPSQPTPATATSSPSVTQPVADRGAPPPPSATPVSDPAALGPPLGEI